MEAETANPNLWDNAQRAQQLMQQVARLRERVQYWEKLDRRITDALELAELEDPDLEGELASEAGALAQTVERAEFRATMSGKYDGEDAILAIHAGSGGTEAQDWAEMLMRMYLRWADQHAYKVEVLEEMEGDGAGIKSTTISIVGDYAYGYLQAERGVHRLVRISPFDAQSRRHTSFALVEVWPDVADDIDIEISEKDIQIDYYRASTAGGQHVQKNSTAVRITHLPTGVIATCENERSQAQNRERAMKVLKARLIAMEQEKQDEEMAKLKGEHVDAGWGNQIRSYVLHPYQMVKDHRTDEETGSPQAVLDGDLDDFIEAYLRSRVGRTA